MKMKTPPPLSPELESFMAPHRVVEPLPQSVVTRSVARAAAAVEWSRPLDVRVTTTMTSPGRWVFAAAATTVVVVGAAAYAARGWIGGSPLSPASPSASPALGAPLARAPSARARVAASAAPEADVAADEAVMAPTVAVEPPPHRRSMSRTSAAPPQTSLAELQLLKKARQDVTNGAYADALTTIGEHSRRFRNGNLVEEREALRVKSLAGLGRREDARRAATELQARFPHSVFLPTFERMMAKGTDR